MTTKYLVFTGDQYYPRAGFDDFRGLTQTYEEALGLAAKHKRDWTQIVHMTADSTGAVLFQVVYDG